MRPDSPRTLWSAQQEELGQIAAMLSDVADMLSGDGPVLTARIQNLPVSDNEWFSLDELRAKVLAAASAQHAVQRA